ncbi:hypothetical protein Tsubulata_047319 [Turnera subulata]|uniref:Bifunctional inhibitor/plant lipid transfer protein/seed storage helical domain-containing protein n=1 Tax=Turnera subulata TaxID=218843 RepID=A0A9Q0G221_9ROSI|nr:hypothetical protein Tsubulata_047319 [Turnera subulata]
MEVVKMERKGVKVAAVAMVFLILFLGEAAADFKTCYTACYLECLIGIGQQLGIPNLPTKKILGCAWKCLKQCTFHSGSPQTYFCNLGCAIDTCEDNIDDAAKMEGCVDSCSKGVCGAKV